MNIKEFQEMLNLAGEIGLTTLGQLQWYFDEFMATTNSEKLSLLYWLRAVQENPDFIKMQTAYYAWI